MSRTRPVSRRFNGPELVGIETSAAIGPRRFLEVTILTIALASILAALAVTAQDPALGGQTMPEDEHRLRATLAALPIRGDLCPPGWQERHAAALGRSQAEIADWHRQEREIAADLDIIRTAGLHLTAPFPYAAPATMDRTHEQILLCIAQERGLTASGGSGVTP